MTASTLGQVIKTAKKAVKSTGLRRDHLVAARMYGERVALAAVPMRRPRLHGRILCYHSVGQPELGLNDVSPRRFRRHIELALDHGYRFVAPAAIAAGNGGPKDLAISFDDALKSVLTEAEPIMGEFGIPYAVFAVSNWADGQHGQREDFFLSWDDLRAMHARGVAIGSHSTTHGNFGAIDIESAKRELEWSRAVIEARLGFAPEDFAIPFGQSNNWTAAAHEAARAAGYVTIYSQAEETRPPGTVPRTFVSCFDNDRIFKALLRGAFDRWEEWTWLW